MDSGSLPVVSFAKERVDALLDGLEAMVAGNENQQVEVSPFHDELDAIAFGINSLADELRYANARVTEAERRLAADLRLSRDKAERANESKTIFLRTASHEIRTPIAAILGIADLLAMGGLSEDDTAHLVARLRSNSRALLSLVGNVLDLSRLDADKLAPHVEPVSPFELVREVVESMEAEATRRGIDLRVDFGMLSALVIETDRLRLRQILVNLIANALKFTPSGWIAISARATEDGNHLAIDVTDTGIGIGEPYVANLFEPFSQLTASPSSGGGSGLGLALSRRLAEHLGGALTLLQSELGKGSTFRLTLDGRPARQAVSAPVSPKTRLIPKPALDGFRILLAEDNPDLQMAIGRALRLEGAQMSHAWNGREAVEMAQAGTFDVVIMDVRMPLMDGLDATRTLRASGYRLPIVALSADSTSEGRAASLAAGCSAYFTKPFDPTELIASIRFLRHHGAERRATPAS